MYESTALFISSLPPPQIDDKPPPKQDDDIPPPQDYDIPKPPQDDDLPPPPQDMLDETQDLNARNPNITRETVSDSSIHAKR